MLYHAVFRHDLTDIYSDVRTSQAADRRLVTQLLSADISEMLCAERVTPVCMTNGLEPSTAMDIKTGYGVYFGSGRKKSLGVDNPGRAQLVVCSPP